MCNMDCLNCIYDDCINDTIGEHEGISDEYTGAKPTYYSLHREEMLEKTKKRRAENLEEYRKRERGYYAKHREKKCAAQKERDYKRYWANPEEARRKKREYYRKRKAEREAQLCKA